MQHINMNTTGDLSRMDKASVDRLPIISPKVSHATAVLMEYKKLMEVQVKVMSLCVKYVKDPVLPFPLVGTPALFLFDGTQQL